MSDSVVILAVLPVLLVFSAVASGSETALFRLSHRERAALRRDAPAVGSAVALLLSDPRRLLLLILIINMLANVAYFVVSSVLTARVDGALMGVAVGVGTVLAIVVFGEILAKVLSGTMRIGFCRLFARPMAALLVVAGPLLFGVDRFVLAPVIRLVRPGDGAPDLLSREELRGLVESGRESGAIGETAWRLLEEVIELGELRVREAMVPRDRVVWVDADEGPEGVLKKAAAHRMTRILVCRGGLDGELVGTVHAKQYLAAMHVGGQVDTEHGVGGASWCMEPVLAVPEQARLDTVLEQMRLRGVTRAVCVDERGSVVGMIAASDIVDELLAGMGEGAGDEKHAIHLIGLGAWTVPAGLGARDWAQAFGIDESLIADVLPRASTVGGVVLDRLGRLASVGDEVRIGTAVLRVSAVSGRRIDEVVVALADDGGRAPGQTGGGA